MTALLLPNLTHADELVLQAVKRRHGSGADFSSRLEGPGISITELIEDDGGSYAAGPDTRHLGNVTRRLARLVYELNVHSTHPLRPDGLTPKSVYVVDTVYPTEVGGRTGYLAVTVGGPPVLMPLPELPPALIDGTGTVEDTRQALRAFAVRHCGHSQFGWPTS
jgi:hypothetical protein